nr:reverse transcriptase domain-containing protein [Tanacetum cinerariifolium]
MVPATTSLTSFSGETIWPLGQIRLLVIIRDVHHSTRAWMNFMIVRSLSPYNGIIGRPGIREIQAMPSTAHGMLKFPVERGIVTICSTILIPTECTSVITSSAISKNERTRPDNFKVALHPEFPDQEVAIGGTLSEKGRTKLCSILKKNLNIFAWQPSDMTGVPRSVAEHRLNIREGYSPPNWSEHRSVRHDLVVKSYTEVEMLRDIDETFRTLRKINMKLNLKKCTFGVAKGVFLGYVVTPDGIKPCSDKTTAVLQLPSPRTIKEVQSLNGKKVLVEVLKDKSIKEKEVTTVVEEDGPTWMTPIVEYIKEGTLLSDRKKARRLCIKARQYELMEGILYRRSFLTPWLRCVGPIQAEYVIREIHEGSCSMHARPRSMGIDIAGPFPEGPGKVKFLIVAMDYFMKWIEAKAVATITGGQSNRLVERSNRSLGEGIKARLGEGNKDWFEELPHVLWAHRTMIKSSHGDTPFSLTYGTEAVIPTEIGMPTPGDFVYRSNNASHAVAGRKLGPKWKGPYEVTEALGDGAYKLRSMDRTILSRTWNIANLKRCCL